MRRRLLLLTVYLMLGTVVSIGCLWAFWQWHLRRAWERYAENARRHGEKLTFREFLPAAVPDDENFAFGTVLMRSAADAKRLKLPAVKKINADATLVEHLEANQKAMVQAGWLRDDGLSLEPGAAVLHGLRRFDPELDALRAARSRPKCAFSNEWASPPQTAFPYLTPVTDVGALWALRMEAHLSLGRRGEALEDFLDCLRLYQAMDGEPTLIQALVQHAVLVRGVRALELGLRAQQWTTEHLSRVDQELGRVNLKADLRRGLLSERGFINDASANVRRLPIKEQAGRIEEMDLLGEEPRGWRLWLKLCSGGSWREQLQGNRVLDYRLSQIASGWQQIFSDSSTPSEFEGITLWGITGVMCRSFAATEMRIRHARAVCSLERFRMVHGVYPQSLKELIPVFAEAIPNDIVNGEALHYSQEASGAFLLYSVGANRRDDGGSTTFDKRIRGQFKALDWVWGKEWK